MNEKSAHRINLLLAVAAALIAGPLFAQAPQKAKDGETRTAANLRNVTRELASEGKEGIKDDKRWPREKPDYATDKNLQMADRVLVMALGRRWDRVPAVDGYVKWQLLSFEPDLAAAGQKGYAAMMKGLPRITPRPELPPNQQRALTAAATRPSEGMKAQLRELIERFQRSVEEVEMLNQPALAYRGAIVEAMPERNGVRMLVRMRDIGDRFEAGDLSYRDAVNTLLDEARSHRDDEGLSRAARRRLVTETDRLHALRNKMVEDAHLLASGAVDLKIIDRVYNQQQYDELIACFTGEDPE